MVRATWPTHSPLATEPPALRSPLSSPSSPLPPHLGKAAAAVAGLGVGGSLRATWPFSSVLAEATCGVSGELAARLDSTWLFQRL